MAVVWVGSVTLCLSIVHKIKVGADVGFASIAYLDARALILQVLVSVSLSFDGKVASLFVDALTLGFCFTKSLPKLGGP